MQFSHLDRSSNRALLAASSAVEAESRHMYSVPQQIDRQNRKYGNKEENEQLYCAFALIIRLWERDSQSDGPFLQRLWQVPDWRSLEKRGQILKGTANQSVSCSQHESVFGTLSRQLV